MKKLFTLLHIALCSAILLFFTQCKNGNGSGGSQKKDAVADLLPLLKSKVDPEVVKGFEDAISKSMDNDPVNIEWLGHYAFLSRQLGTAAWLYAEAAAKKPDDYLNLNNLGLCLHELFLAEQDQKTSSLLQEAINTLEKAAAGVPGNADIQNNLGYAEFEQYKINNDPAVLKKAEGYLLNAVNLDPANATYQSHLADVYGAMDKTDQAIGRLNNAFRLDPLNGVYIKSAAGFPSFASDSSSRSWCDSFNYNCVNICPPSIIGQLERVNCLMAEQAARIACNEGKPYTTTYDCNEEMPITGFLIPGLNSGFTILTPFGKLSTMLQNKDNIDFKFDLKSLPGMLKGLKFNVAGSYNPKSGMSHTKFGPSFSVNLYDEGDVVEQMNKLGVGPVSVKANFETESIKQTEMILQSYNTPVLHSH